MFDNREIKRSNMLQRRIFSPEFKAEAVKLVNERGVTKSQAARDLGIHLSVLRYWIGKIGRQVQVPHTTPGTSEEAEILDPKREVAQPKTGA
jgi:transposase